MAQPQFCPSLLQSALHRDTWSQKKEQPCWQGRQVSGPRPCEHSPCSTSQHRVADVCMRELLGCIQAGGLFWHTQQSALKSATPAAGKRPHPGKKIQRELQRCFHFSLHPAAAGDRNSLQHEEHKRGSASSAMDRKQWCFLLYSDYLVLPLG